MGYRRGRLVNKFSSPPSGEPWAWLQLSLMCSSAWRVQSINCRRLIEFLIVEHGNHRARENGKLMATYDQLEVFGVTRSRIKSAIAEAVELGLLRVTREGGRRAGSNQPSLYRLTFYADHTGAPPTNEWKAVERRHAREFQHDQNERREKRAQWRRNLKNQNQGSTPDTSVVR
jgi:hypothetical protein